MEYTIQNNFLAISVSEMGAELQSIRGADGTQYLWQGDPLFWKDRALNIFPYVARLTQEKYSLDGQEYQMRIHGIAPYARFRAVEIAQNQLTMELTDNRETYASYPRRFSLRVIYSLRENNLDIRYEVANRDDKPMYFGIGGHPGFNVPLIPGLAFSDYRLEFGAPCKPTKIGFSEHYFLNGTDLPFPLEDDRILPLEHELFRDDAIVLRDMAPSVTLLSDKDPRRITVTYPQMQYLGLWHAPRSQAPYICIEPWSSLPAKQDEITVFEEQEDLIYLAPGKEYHNSWSIHFWEDTAKCL